VRQLPNGTSGYQRSRDQINCTGDTLQPTLQIHMTVAEIVVHSKGGGRGWVECNRARVEKGDGSLTRFKRILEFVIMT
jgi:hypothetical protein